MPVQLAALMFLLVASPKQHTLVAETPLYELQQIGSRSYAFITAPDQYEALGSNSGFIITPDGVVVIDAHNGATPETEIIKAIGHVTSLPITHVVNTHFHADHSGGNAAHAAATRILAHSGSQRRLTEGTTRTPDVGLLDDQTLFPGPHEIRVIAVGKAHSIGDLLVYDPRDQVLWGGDMYISGMIGYLSEGWFKQWIAALDRVLALPLRWAVPGHGPITDPAGLRAFRDYLLAFARSARDHFAAGGSRSDYRLPAPYDRWGAQFFLLGNLTRAEALYRSGELDGL